MGNNDCSHDGNGKASWDYNGPHGNINCDRKLMRHSKLN